MLKLSAFQRSINFSVQHSKRKSKLSLNDKKRVLQANPVFQAGLWSPSISRWLDDFGIISYVIFYAESNGDTSEWFRLLESGFFEENLRFSYIKYALFVDMVVSIK